MFQKGEYVYIKNFKSHTKNPRQVYVFMIGNLLIPKLLY